MNLNSHLHPHSALLVFWLSLCTLRDAVVNGEVADVTEACESTPASADWQCLLDVGKHEVSREQPLLVKGVPLLVEGGEQVPSQRRPQEADAVVAGSVVAMRGSDISGAQLSTKNKLVLVALETFPLVGWLGFDRIYLGQIGLGLLKMFICICTLFLGGAIWGLLDGYAVIVNALHRETSLDRFGMVARFDEQHVEASRFLAIVTLVCWAALFICCIRAAGARYRKSKAATEAANEPIAQF